MEAAGKSAMTPILCMYWLNELEPDVHQMVSSPSNPLKDNFQHYCGLKDMKEQKVKNKYNLGGKVSTGKENEKYFLDLLQDNIGKTDIEWYLNDE